MKCFCVTVWILTPLHDCMAYNEIVVGVAQADCGRGVQEGSAAQNS